MDHTCSLIGHPALRTCAYTGDKPVIKAGLLPYMQNEEGVRFLLHRPKPVRNPQDVLPFQIARGSREAVMEGEAVELRDHAEAIRLLEAGAEMIPAQQTALREAEEELGLPADAITCLYDCGVLAYKDYGIHCFMAQVAEDVRLLPARDSAEVAWLSQKEVSSMAATGAFNPGYLPLLDAMAQTIPNRK